jgi:hypothetical protein
LIKALNIALIDQVHYERFELKYERSSNFVFALQQTLQGLGDGKQLEIEDK